MNRVFEFVEGQPIPGTRYRVHKKLGQGGMGTVYDVVHGELGKHFVLKALLAELAEREDLVQRLRNEWRALGRLEHPNIVTVTDAGNTASGVPFFVMELLEGETLAERLHRVGRLSVTTAVNIAAAILDGVAAAHAIGIVHRDIKPPNVMLIEGDTPKLLDFGIAKIADDPRVVTLRGVSVGTPRYMSPEQARGESVDCRADIYAVGLLLYEMITGESPFEDARDTNELILAHIARLAPPMGARVPVSAELERVVASMLAKDHEKRPPTARAAALLLRQSLQEELGLAPTEPVSGPGVREKVAAGVPPSSPKKQSIPLPPLTLTPPPAFTKKPTLGQLAIVGSVVLLTFILLGVGIARRRQAFRAEAATANSPKAEPSAPLAAPKPLEAKPEVKKAEPPESRSEEPRKPAKSRKSAPGQSPSKSNRASEELAARRPAEPVSLPPARSSEPSSPRERETRLPGSGL